jgi:hypothetical protein
MAEGPSRDPIITSLPTDEDTGNDSGVESVTARASSLTHGTTLMAKGKILELSEFFKKTSITDGERKAHHERGWLTGNIISSVPEVDVPTIEGSTAIYFDSHLIAGLGLPPNKFLVTIMGYLNCELFHFNPNAISVLSTFIMLYECWLGIASDTSLFWYYYSPVRYTKVVYGGIGLSLRPIVMMNIFQLPSKVAGKDPKKGGSWWICTNPRRVETSSCFPQSSRISGMSRR